MSFEDRPFLILFAITYVLWWIVRKQERAAVTLLLAASLVFYGHKHWQLLPILLTYCVLDWAVALRIERSQRPRLWVAIGVTFNLAVLAFYKYTPLVATTFFGYQSTDFTGWAIPFGISFYAFTGVAYLVDVYRRVLSAEMNLVRYTLSAAFFPHLVAGPILRPHEFLDYVRPGKLATDPKDVPEAMWLIARGFFKKLVVANRIGLAIDPFFAHVNDPTTAGAWALPYVYLYALQIYFDFSAYTDLARGIGLLFGYRWPENFDLPYLATNIAAFWRRWHMTLSRFLRDYLYIPLGGNRHGPIRTNVNLMITMLLGGLWHGANWSFLVWGGLHGSFLIVHKAWASTPIARWLNGTTGVARTIWIGIAGVLTFHAVCLAWCFFRLTVFAESIECVRKCVAFDPTRMWSGTYTDPSVLMGIGSYALILFVALAAKTRGEPTPFRSGLAWGLRVATLLLAVLLAPPDVGQPFIYFQF
ncbi:MAG TPA: MBOAT family O-acyltransferase [Gemmataceae bacterium]|jgi:D-alanyl-lipoteichoic acid acyltransferase DltB (MBOAT superfamily)|nr:MBOAT family O-acyltransferase [Gemmataceae bacterium]